VSSQADAGPDQLYISGTSTYLAGNYPLSGTGFWDIIHGAGGIITDTTSPTSAFSGLSGNLYILRWTILNNCGSSSDYVAILFSSSGPSCDQPLIDPRDGQSYSTVQIGAQCWMAENINIGTRIDRDNSQTDNQVMEKYCYNDSETFCDDYGGLYQWNEIMQYDTIQGSQGVCPEGWHIPTDFEWKLLEGTVDSLYGVGDPIWNVYALRGYNAGLNLKSTSSWLSDGNGTDLYGFSGLPAGQNYFSIGLYYIDLGYDAYFWSPSQNSLTGVWSRRLDFDSFKVKRFPNNKEEGFSLRCLKDG